MNKIHRFFSLFLCLAFVLFCLSVPIRSTAAADAGLVTMSLGGVSVSVSGFIAVVVLVLSGLGIVWGSIEEAVAEAQLWYNTVPKIVKDWLDKAGQDVVEGHTTVKIPETVIEGINSIDDAYQLSPSSPYLDTSGFNLDTISPTDLFAQDVVGAIQQTGSTTHSLLRTLYGLLNTEFANTVDFIETQTSAISTGFSNLGSKITSLNSNLVSKLSTLDLSLGSIETSVDVMSSTLSDDLTDLKSVYSSFGNETLSKLDTLNESIKAIDVSSSLSADFVDLRETIMEYDSLTLTAIQDLPDLISASLSDFYDLQSLQLEEISSKLGTFEESFLETMSGNLQLVRDEVSNGFADTLVALDQLDITADIDLQPVVDQILSTEMTVNDSLNSLYTAIDSLEVDMTADFQPVIDQIIESEAILCEPLIYLDQFNWDVIHPSLESILSSFGSVQTSLDSINDQVLYGLDTSIGALRAALTNEFSFLKLRTADLFSSLDESLTTQLTDIKTAVQAIAGTTTADPNPGGNNSQDEYEKEKAPLMPWIGSGFEIGGSYFNSIEGFLGDDMDAFLVAGMIFEEFAGMTFFYKLIIISCSIGLIGTLLGMALQLQSYSVAQRRREEAAQSKAHVRMERSCAA